MKAECTCGVCSGRPAMPGTWPLRRAKRTVTFVPRLPRSSAAARSVPKPTVSVPLMLTTFARFQVLSVNYAPVSILMYGPVDMANERCTMFHPSAAPTSSPGFTPARAAGLPSSDVSTSSRMVAGSWAPTCHAMSV